MARIRPLFGSATMTVPLYGPSAWTAARRTMRSSPSTESPSVESANVGVFQGPPGMFLAVTAWATGTRRSCADDAAAEGLRRLVLRWVAPKDDPEISAKRMKRETKRFDLR